MSAAAPPGPESFYRDAAAAAARDEATLRTALHRLSLARLATIVGGAACWVASRRMEPTGAGGPILAAAALLALGFAALVIVHRRAGSRHAQVRRRRLAAEAGIARVTRDWAAMPRVRWTPPLTIEQVVLARDLGVTGDVSLHRLLDMTTPSLGSARVVQWLLSDPPPVETIDARADSVAALRAQGEALLDFAAAGRTDRRVLDRGVKHFAEWLGRETSPSGTRVPAVLAAISVVAAVLIVGILALQPSLAGAATILIAVQVTIAVVARRRVNSELHGVGDAVEQLDEAIGVMARAVAMDAMPGRYGAIQEELRRDGALAAFARLRRLLEWNNIRYTPLAHWLLNASVGLDVYIWRDVRRWRAKHRGTAARWVDAAADAEALVALATLGFDHPGWPRARVHEEDAAPPLDARALGHPSLVPDRVVRNDLVLERRGAVAVVSGSNMAGKTTYLRAAGLDTLLAQAGGPVCADAMHVRRCRVRTSVRIEDDLGSGVSLFMAEAMRLRTIVAEAESAKDGGAPPVLFLLDEILHGTNAHDRREATRLVLRRLAAAGASGLVTTHDPSIAGDGDRQLHFRETITAVDDGFRMDFDHTAREGPATTANALAVLRMLGLE